MQIFIYCKVAVNKYLHTVASGWICINTALILCCNGQNKQLCRYLLLMFRHTLQIRIRLKLTVWRRNYFFF